MHLPLRIFAFFAINKEFCCNEVKRSMISQSMRFLLVGVYNTVVGYLLFYLIEFALGNFVHYLGILILSYVLSLTHAYLGQRFIVFRSKALWFHEYLRFLMVNLAGMAINGLLLVLFVECGVPVMRAQAISIITVTLISYIGHQKFSFKSS